MIKKLGNWMAAHSDDVEDALWALWTFLTLVAVDEISRSRRAARLEEDAP